MDCQDCVIADNTIRSIGVNSEWGGGIRLSWGSSRNQVLRNVMDNTGRGGIFADNGSTDLVISSNTVTRGGRKAEKLSNEISRNPAEGLELGGSGLDQIRVANNIISGNSFAAVTGSPGADLEWTNNTVTGNGDNTQLTSRGFAHRAPMADFSCPTSASAGQFLTFTNRSTTADGGLGHALRDFGEGVPDTPLEGAHTYSRPGT